MVRTFLALATVVMITSAALACPPAASFQAGYSTTTVQTFALPAAAPCPCQANALSLQQQQSYAAPLSGSVGGCGGGAAFGLQQGYGLNAGYGTFGAGVGAYGAGSLALNGLGAYGTGLPLNALPRGYGLGGGIDVLALARQRQRELEFELGRQRYLRPFGGFTTVAGAARLAELAALAARRAAFFPFPFHAGLANHR